uniref:F-box/kelch-repeat protein n=1 Tax=Noccaea caerulescens TaxID=107243 RepID=A0A1J3FTB6_NOCCA
MRNSMMHTCWRCSKKKNRVPRKMDQSHHGGGFRDLLMDQSHHGGGSRDLLRVCNERAEHNKRRKEDASLPSSSYGLLDSLPDVVVISCLARLSRLDQAALSLVSKSCRSLVASAEFKKTRSLMGCAEKYAYICLRMPPDPHPRWFVLRPTLVAATGKTVRQAHAIPSPPSQPPEGSAVVALDCGIYVVGGLVDGKPTSGVLLLDCWDHTWHHVSPMRVARASPGARVLDGKIYVLGGCEDDKNSSDWGEVFDPNTQTWAALPKPILEEDTDPDTLPRMDLIRDSVLIDDKVYVVDAGNKSFFYSPESVSMGKRQKGLV